VKRPSVFELSRESVLEDAFDDAPLAADERGSWRTSRKDKAEAGGTDSIFSRPLGSHKVHGNAGPRVNPLLMSQKSRGYGESSKSSYVAHTEMTEDASTS
jgi:hypothetical protein